MKKLILALVAAFAISAPAFANDHEGDEAGYSDSEQSAEMAEHGDMAEHHEAAPVKKQAKVAKKMEKKAAKKVKKHAKKHS